MTSFSGATVDFTGTTFSANGGTAIFDGTTNLTSAGSTFGNVQLGTALVGGSLTTTGNLTIAGALTILNGAATTLDITADTLTFSAPGGNVDLTGLDTFTVTGSTVVLDLTGTLTSAGYSFNHFTVGPSGLVTLADPLDVNGDLTISDGTLLAGGNQITVAGIGTAPGEGRSARAGTRWSSTAPGRS